MFKFGGLCVQGRTDWCLWQWWSGIIWAVGYCIPSLTLFVNLKKCKNTNFVLYLLFPIFKKKNLEKDLKLTPYASKQCSIGKNVVIFKCYFFPKVYANCGTYMQLLHVTDNKMYCFILVCFTVPEITLGSFSSCSWCKVIVNKVRKQNPRLFGVTLVG